MDQNSAASAYQQSIARSASAVGQVVSLYDTILRDFRRALAAIESGKVETRVFELNHALTIIGELQGVLDFQRGGEAAKSLDHFYRVTRPMILEANISASRDSLLRLIELYQGIRNAWHAVEQKLPHSEPRLTAPRSVGPPPSTSDAGHNPSGRWSG